VYTFTVRRVQTALASAIAVVSPCDLELYDLWSTLWPWSSKVTQTWSSWTTVLNVQVKGHFFRTHRQTQTNRIDWSTCTIQVVVKITPSPNLITVILSTISSPSLSYPLSSRFRTYLFHKSSSPEALLLLPALPSCTITRTVSSELPGFLLRPRERWRSIVMSASVCVCVSVCISVCLSASISPEQHAWSLQNFCACFLWPWLGPPPAGWRMPRGRAILGVFFPINNALYT